MDSIIIIGAYMGAALFMETANLRFGVQRARAMG